MLTGFVVVVVVVVESRALGYQVYLFGGFGVWFLWGGFFCDFRSLFFFFFFFFFVCDLCNC